MPQQTARLSQLIANRCLFLKGSLVQCSVRYTIWYNTFHLHLQFFIFALSSANKRAFAPRFAVRGLRGTIGGPEGGGNFCTFKACLSCSKGSAPVESPGPAGGGKFPHPQRAGESATERKILCKYLNLEERDPFSLPSPSGAA